MNKSELIDGIAAATGLTKADAGRALDATTDSIASALQQGNSVSLVGFGTFTVRHRAARTGRNPRTGEVVPVPDRKVPVFKPSNEFKNMITKLGI